MLDDASGAEIVSQRQLGKAEFELASPPVAAPPGAGGARETGFAHTASNDLKRRTVHGALVSTVGQGASLILRTGSMMILARLLLKEDFGLVNMVTAATGFLGLLKDAGLSSVTVQRASITNAQISTLFWINLAIGGVLAGLAAAAAPVLVSFYGEPRLFWVAVILGAGFVFDGAGAQHRAMLQRGMRFMALAAIDMGAYALSTVVAVGMAAAGHGYWALVALNILPPAASLVGVCSATRWTPGKPRRGAGVRSMLWFGGTVTLNSVIAYLAFNLDKVFVGRFFGPEALGVYGRAYQLINLPTANLTTTIGLVAFPALSRVQHEPSSLRSYFLKGYGTFLCLVLPITVACALFSEDIIRVFLGAKWQGAAPIFRLLAPTTLAFAVINPFGWLMLATGRAARSLKIGLVIAPVVILGYILGLRCGPHGVAAGFSVSMVASAAPLVLWAKRGTLITVTDLLLTAVRPGLSALAGAAVTLSAGGLLGLMQPVFPRLVLESILLFAVYLLVLLFVFKQKAVYAQMLQEAHLWPFRRKERNNQTV
ncbi:MAG: lipopolysaccharide biosynthesis protein [Limisphaerales bacterium]